MLFWAGRLLGLSCVFALLCAIELKSNEKDIQRLYLCAHLSYQSNKVASDFDPSWVFLLFSFVISSQVLVILFLVAIFYDQSIV